MKKWTLAIVAIAFLVACQPKGYQINGTIEGATTGKVFLNHIRKNMPEPIDTAEMVDGKFSFKGSVEAPELYVAFIEGQQAPLLFFVENSKIEITGKLSDLRKAEVKGSKAQDLYKKFNDEIPGNERMQVMQQEAMQAQMSQDGEKMQLLQEEANSIMEDQMAYFEKFLGENLTNEIGAFLALNMAQSKSLEELKEMLTKLEAALPNHVYVAELREMIAPLEEFESATEAIAEGKVAPDFTLTTKDGAEVSLSSLRGKYVLVDFWASWCAPCRAENPNVVKAYNAYKAKGFDVLSVSVDSDEAKWLEAVAADGLVWTQVRDAENVVSKQYAIQSIPTTLLLDKEGIIIAKNLRGKQLEAKLAELLN